MAGLSYQSYFEEWETSKFQKGRTLFHRKIQNNKGENQENTCTEQL